MSIRKSHAQRLTAGSSAIWMCLLGFISTPACSPESDRSNPQNAHSIVLFSQDDIEPYFKTNQLMVSSIRWAEKGEGNRRNGFVEYPSLNHGGKKGNSTVIYSHQSSFILDPAARDLIDSQENVLWILAIENASEYLYRPVGYIPSTESEHMDWFADKPELLFKGE